MGGVSCMPMKTIFPLSSRSSLITFAALLIAQCSPLLEAEPAPVPPTPQSAAQSDPNPEATRVNLQFENTELSKIISFLREKFQGANFMVQPKAESVRVTLNVRNVGVEQALQAVAFASDGRVAVNRMDYRFYGLVLADPAAFGNAAQKPTCRVFNLSTAQNFSDQQANPFLDELENSISETITSLRKADPVSTVEAPTLQFHRPTKLLVAVGKPEDLAVVEQFVVALGGKASNMAAPARNVAPGGMGIGGSRGPLVNGGNDSPAGVLREGAPELPHPVPRP